MKIKVIQSIGQSTTWEELRRWTDSVLNQAVNVLNGHVGFIDNCDTSLVTCSFKGINSSQGFSHTLRRVPSGYIVVQKPASLDVYDGMGTNTSTTIYLKSTVAADVTVLVF